MKKKSLPMVIAKRDKTWEFALQRIFVEVMTKHFDTPFTAMDVRQAIENDKYGRTISPMYIRKMLGPYFRSHVLAARLVQLPTFTLNKQGRPQRQYQAVNKFA